MQDTQNNYEHPRPVLLGELSPAADNPKQSQHCEKDTDQHSDDYNSCGGSVVALPKDYTASHSDHRSQDGNRSHQTQNPEENVKHGPDLDLDIQIRVRILTFRIAGGGRE
jgi:hypothetical protein